MNYYPILVDVDYKKIVIVGGGLVAAQKIASLRATKASIVVVSPVLHDTLIPLAEEGVFTWLKKHFEPKDVDDAMLIFAATDHTDVNVAVQEACQHWQLVNRVDEQQTSDFITPAIVRRGSLVIAVSTSGASPTLARQLKKDLEEQYDDAYEEYVDFLQQARETICATFEKGAQRRSALKALLAPDVLIWTREGNTTAREQFLLNLLTGDVE